MPVPNGESDLHGRSFRKRERQLAARSARGRFVSGRRSLAVQTRAAIAMFVDLCRKVQPPKPHVYGDPDADNNFKADAQRRVGSEVL